MQVSPLLAVDIADWTTSQKSETVNGIHKEIIVPSSSLSQNLPWYLRGLPPKILSWAVQRMSPERHGPLLRTSLEEDANSGERPTLLSKALGADDPDTKLEDEIIVKEAKAFIVAGTDTTATYLIWQVMKHPRIRARLQQELDGLSPEFSIADVLALKYLHCIINEALRMDGAVAGGLPRTTPKGGREIAGYFIPENTIVSTQAFTLHRNAEIFEDSLSFLPERWENPTSEMKGAFMPFGIGSRGESITFP